MINQNEMPAFVEETIPELKGVCANTTPYQVARELIKYTRTQLLHHNITNARKCLSLAEKLYKKGNFAIRNAIENVFVFSLSHTFIHGIEGQELKQLMPAGLNEVYKRQVLYSHI